MASNFREKFFQASQLSKEERASLKNQFPRDKRGQGLGYRLEYRNKELQPSNSDKTYKRKISEGDGAMSDSKESDSENHHHDTDISRGVTASLTTSYSTVESTQCQRIENVHGDSRNLCDQNSSLNYQSILLDDESANTVNNCNEKSKCETEDLGKIST